MQSWLHYESNVISYLRAYIDYLFKSHLFKNVYTYAIKNFYLNSSRA